MSKGKTFLAVTLALAAGVGGGMMAGVKTAQNKEEKIQAEAVEQAEDKGYEEGYQAGVVVNQGYSQQELDEAVSEAEAAKQTIIDGLNEEKQTLTQQNTTLTEQNAVLETQNQTLTQENESLTAANQALEQQIEAGATVEAIAPGLYDPGTGEMTTSWSDLIEQGIISLDENGVCQMNIDIPASGSYRPEQIEGALDKLNMIQGKLVLSSDVRTIARYGFAYASGLTEIVVPEGVTEIQGYAFRYCDNLSKVTLPETLTTLGTYAFASCFINEINIPSLITNLPNYLFSRAFFDYNKIFVIPDTVVSIGTKTFGVSEGIIFVPETVETINANAFSGDIIALFEADSVPGNIEITGATVVTGVSKSQVNYYTEMIKNKNILASRIADGVVVFQDKNKIKFYNFLEESLVTYGTESQSEYQSFMTYSEDDFILNNAEATYVYDSTNDSLQIVSGLQVALTGIFSIDETNGFVYATASDGIYKIDTNLATLANANITGQDAYQKIFNYAVEEISAGYGTGVVVFNANNKTYIFESATGNITQLRDSSIQNLVSMQYNFSPDGDVVAFMNFFDENDIYVTEYYFVILTDGTFVEINENPDFIANLTENGYDNYAIIETFSGVYVFDKTTGTFDQVLNDFIDIETYSFNTDGETFANYHFETRAGDQYIFEITGNQYDFYLNQTVVAH